MQIGPIAKQTGVSVEAIRFYERNGLLADPPSSEGGFRLYSSDDLTTLQFTRSLQTLGFSLTEIREFKSLRTNDLLACSAVGKMLDGKRKDIHAKRVALAKREVERKGASSKCNSPLKRSLPSPYRFENHKQGYGMKIEVLYVPNCPNYTLALERLREILSTESFQKHVNQVLVRDAEMARSLEFLGSPTIRINGNDVEPQSETIAVFGLMCRLYSDGSGAPSRQKLRAAIEKAEGAGV
jgi:DNA-binding transcriptional MerR regulator